MRATATNGGAGTGSCRGGGFSDQGRAGDYTSAAPDHVNNGPHANKAH